jgi:circadian clock protein KaiC
MSFEVVPDLVKTGVDGLDHILAGGFPAQRMYLIQGDPGTGKTTLALQMLLYGRDRGERVLYVTLSESTSELQAVARSHGWDLDRVDIYEMVPHESLESLENTLYVPAEVELGERMVALLGVIGRVEPRRVVIDSCSELRLLAQTPLRFRRQILALKQYLETYGCTMLLLENPLSSGGDVLLQSLVHGVLHLEQLSPHYGSERRRLRIIKMREVRFRGGYHDFLISRGGLVVFPRLVASEHVTEFGKDRLASGIEGLDALLGGGLDPGTSYLFIGPAGSGKSSVATLYAHRAAMRGEQAAVLLFEESAPTLLARSEALGMGLREHVAAGRVLVQQLEPAEVSPGEFAARIHAMVEGGVRLLVVDSLNGYLHSMLEEQALLVHLHELVSYLRRSGVITVLVLAQHGLVGPSMASPVDATYLADGVVLFRFFEAEGRVRKAISVLKKRSGYHEDTIREFTMGPNGLDVSGPLAEFRGVLSGVPLLRKDDKALD